MQIVGIDVGYGFTKSSYGLKFPSKITKETPLLTHNRKLMIEKDLYYIGIGRENVDVSRNDDELFKICLIYAILASVNESSDVCVVTGLPLIHMKSHAEKLREMILTQCNNITCTCDEIKRILRIKDCAVYPQCLASIYNYLGNVICLDLGSRTTDLVFVSSSDGRRRVAFSDTIYDGMMTLYQKITKAINQEFSLTLTPDMIQSILDSGLFIDGVEVKTDFILDIIKEHVEKISNLVKLSVPYKTTNAFKITGGGAIALGSEFKKIFPRVEISEYAQFENCTGYLQKGIALWRKAVAEI